MAASETERERERLLRELRESQERVRLLVDSLPHGIQENDLEGIITYSNRAHSEMHGYAAGELIGVPIFQLVPAGAERAALEEHFAAILRDEPAPTPWIGRDLTKDGRLIDVRVDWDYRRDEDGRLAGFACVVTDITEQRRAEEALRQERAHLESLKESAEDFVLYRLASRGDAAFRAEVVLVSPSIREVMGVEEPRDFSSWFAAIHSDDLERVQAANAHSAATGAPFDQVMRIRHPDKEGWRWIRALSRPVLGEDGKPRYFNGLIVDITDLKRAEEERKLLEQKIQRAQKLESLGVLAGGIAHDFNNLLMGILGNSELALQRIPPETPGRPNVRDIESIAQRALELTGQLLAFSGTGRFAAESLDLNRLLQELARLLRGVLPAGASIRFELEPTLPPIEADAGQIRQVAMNLLTNAAESLGGRAGVIRVRTGTVRVDDAYRAGTDLQGEAADGLHVFLEVADTGAGMDEETRQRLFEPFFTTKPGGRGLGMAALLGIIRGHRGAIGVESSPGRGSTFRVLLPLGRP